MRSKQRAALRKLFSPRPDKASYVAGTNILSRRYTGIYKHLLSQCFENAVLWCLKMVKCKCFFLTSNRNMFVRKFVKWVGFLPVNFKNSCARKNRKTPVPESLFGFYRCFPVNFAKSLSTPFLQNSFGLLLLTLFKYFTTMCDLVPVVRKFSCAYVCVSGEKKCYFFGNFAYVLNKWSLTIISCYCLTYFMTNLWFSDVFRGYIKRPVAWNGLIQRT